MSDMNNTNGTNSRDGLGIVIAVVSWLINAAMFIIGGVVVAGFAYAIIGVISWQAGLVAALITFIVAGYITYKVTDAIFGGLGRAIGGAIKNSGESK